MLKEFGFWSKVILSVGIAWLSIGRIPSAAPLDILSAHAPEQPSDVRFQLSSSWQPPLNISHTPTSESRAPALAVSRSGTVHIVWEEGRYIYHSYRAGDSWSVPWRVAVGEQPAIAIDHNDVPHLVFVNEFRGNYEIYYCQWTGTSWTLPRNVSSTSGVSAIPDIAVDSRNTVQVVWADNSPGYNVIYYGRWTGTFWINRPIPHARGSVPAMAIGGDDLVHVVWQDRDSLTDPYEVYHTQWDGSTWSLPEDVSDSSNQSTIPDIAVGFDGTVHVAWEEQVGERGRIYYSGGRSLFWSPQEDICQSQGNSYLPSITISGDGFPYVAWDDGDRLVYRWRMAFSMPWAAEANIARNLDGIADIAIVAQEGGKLYAAWAERLSDGQWDVFYSEQASPACYFTRLPLLLFN